MGDESVASPVKHFFGQWKSIKKITAHYVRPARPVAR